MDQTCTWTEVEAGVWWTDCENAWEFVVGTPTENRMQYCPFCGRKLVEVRGEGGGMGCQRCELKGANKEHLTNALRDLLNVSDQLLHEIVETAWNDGGMSDLVENNSALRKENERLREALKSITKMDPGEPGNCAGKALKDVTP
jgi:hypothetical protein